MDVRAMARRVNEAMLDCEAPHSTIWEQYRARGGRRPSVHSARPGLLDVTWHCSACSVSLV
eukprot:4580426-Pyramimonas_sp.AAC.1